MHTCGSLTMYIINVPTTIATIVAIPDASHDTATCWLLCGQLRCDSSYTEWITYATFNSHVYLECSFCKLLCTYKEQSNQHSSHCVLACVYLAKPPRQLQLLDFNEKANMQQCTNNISCYMNVARFAGVNSPTGNDRYHHNRHAYSEKNLSQWFDFRQAV